MVLLVDIYCLMLRINTNMAKKENKLLLLWSGLLFIDLFLTYVP